MKSLFLERSIPQLRDGLCKGEITFVDLVATTARTIASEETRTLAWVCFDMVQLAQAAERAEASYRTRGSLLPLDGIPFGVKDIFNTRDFPTQMGSPLWDRFTPGNNARVVDRLVDAGALVAGKTVTAEFAVHALNETLNPHDPARTPGTSSSGSAAAVATGMIPFALASQTAGSIVRPASFCGIWGMKPSFGLIPRTGVLKTTDSLDCIGFVAAHAANLRPVLDNIRVSGPNYPFVFNNVDRPGARPKAAKRPWRIGFVKTHVWGTATAYARESVERLAAAIDGQQDFQVEEVDWPANFSETHQIHSTIYNKSLSYYFKNEAKYASDISPIMAEMIAVGELVSLDTFSEALGRQVNFCRSLDQFLSPFDLVLSLGTSSSAPARGVDELDDPSLVWTLGHVPSVAAPTFVCPDGLPYGVQFISRKWQDYLLLQGIEELVARGVLPEGSRPISKRKIPGQF